MKTQEASKDITKGGIMFPSPKTSYMEGNTQNDKETIDFALKIALKRPKCAVMRPKCLSCAPSALSHLRLMKIALVRIVKRCKCAESEPNMLS